MAFNPGRNVGRLSIRVVPDTTQFRRELKRQLDTISRTTSMTVRVSKAKIDNTAIREDIRRQMEEFKGLDAAVNVQVTVDKARLKKTKLRKSIQDQFDQFSDIRVNIAAQIQNKERFEKEVRDMVSRASRNEVKIRAAAHTLDASAQMAWLSRDRFVNLVVQVNKKSLASAATTLAALSGARLSGKWIDDLAQMARNLDKNLPSILGWTTGVTSLVASLFGATSGLVGVGQGLFSILPAFLVLPGLFLNAAGSLTALVVALRHAGEELAPLKAGMNELGGIIRSAFWDQARQPILDLVNGLMPQLRNSFRELSTGVGQFTGALAEAFGTELAGGNLESIFTGIAEGWRILSTGAPAFAGAMTSLSQIAATYTPRLASWFVRQANTFDTWLEAVSTDGRLDGWMETAIDSMYDLWDATKGAAGVFKGLWRAADAAGSKGLAGFADMMQEWDRVVNGADFQRGLTAVFRGANVAMSSFGSAVRAIGRLVADLDGSFERFIGSSGKFFFGIFEGAANALNQPLVGKGMDDLSAGLITALEGVLPHLPAIAATFGNFLGLLGDLAGTLLPTAVGVIADLMPTIDSLISSIRDSGVLQTLGDAVTDIAEQLGPALEGFADAAGPVLIDALVGLADALVDIAPVLVALIDTLGEWISALGEWSTANGDFFDGVREFMGWDKDTSEGLKSLGKLGAFKPEDDGDPFTVAVKFDFERYWNDSRMTTADKARGIAKVFMDEYENVLATEGQGAADKLVESFRNIEGLPPEVIAKINDSLKQGFALPDLTPIEDAYLQDVVTKVKDAYKSGGAEGAAAMWKEVTAPNAFNLGSNTENMRLWAESILSDAKITIPNPTFDPNAASVASEEATRIADRIRDSFTTGNKNKAWMSEFWSVDVQTRNQIMQELGDLADEARDKLDINRGERRGGGGGFSRQLAQGILLGLPELDASVRTMRDTVTKGMIGSDTLLAPEGAALIGGLQAGIAGATPALTTTMSSMGGVLQGAMADAGSWLYPTGSATMLGMRNGAVDTQWSVAGAFTGLRGTIAGTLAGAGGWFYGVGAAMMAGIARGIAENSGAVSRAAGAAVDRAVNAARAAGEIHSPSRRTNREIGAPLMQGIAVGIRKESFKAERAMVDGIDFSGLAGVAPSITGTDGSSSARGVAVHIHNPVVRDLQQEAWEAAQLVGQAGL
ncbi:hypothetical protein [Microbacterium sp. K24]|uniref:hypothetical protein n=1 Tax=Microbacterium sp. K24 TaxID=2305446 RepID=UPI00109C5B0F|nr:hypothetical protein [Microbacterium sp. K24]